MTSSVSNTENTSPPISRPVSPIEKKDDEKSAVDLSLVSKKEENTAIQNVY
ncbi:MAG TPA: hypothetical protein VGA80_12340 [Flavobacteriaceae bacterium]